MRKPSLLASISGAIALSMAIAGCASTAKPVAAGTPAATVAPVIAADPEVCRGVTLNFIGLAGEEGDKELASFRANLGMKLQVSNIGDWGQIIGSIKVGQHFDLVSMSNASAQRMIAAGVVQPLDTSKLGNWNDVVSGLRNSSLIRGAGDKVYGAPIAWGDGPIVYDVKRVPVPPTTITDLLKPAWKGRFTMWDDYSIPFYTLAQSLGFDKVPLLTMDQLKQVEQLAKKLVKNAGAFQTSYQDASDRMVAGDIDLSIGGWEAMTGWAKAKGGSLAYSFIKEGNGGGWFDNLSIPSTSEHPACALAYIDAMISAKTQAAVATDLVSGATNSKAKSLIKADVNIYDYKLVESATPGIEFVTWVPSDPVPAGYASVADWQKAWARVKIG